MKILNSGEGLGKEDRGLFFGKYSFLILIIEKIALFSVFHDHVDFGVLLENLP